MGLPETRNTEYAEESQVKSADLNDFQDQIIALYRGRQAPAWFPLALTTYIPFAGGGPSITWLDGGGAQVTGGTSMRIPIPVRAGQRITGFRARVDPSPAGVVGLV